MSSTRPAVLRLAAPALSALLAAACYESPTPIDALPRVDLDASLFGTWRCLPFEAEAAEEAATLTVARGHERVYAATFAEPGKDPDRYEGHSSLVGETTLVNLREVSNPRAAAAPWVFVRPTLLRPSLLLLAVLGDQGLPDAPAPGALREALRQREGSPGAYKEFCACVRARPSDPPAGTSGRLWGGRRLPSREVMPRLGFLRRAEARVIEDLLDGDLVVEVGDDLEFARCARVPATQLPQSPTTR